MFGLLLMVLGFAGPVGDEKDVGPLQGPKYLLGQEIVYSGTILETHDGVKSIRYEQPYDLEATVLVTRVDAFQNAELGCYTALRLPNHDRDEDEGSMEGISSFRFDQVKVTPQGSASWMAGPNKGKPVIATANGQTPWEAGFVLEVPKSDLAPGSEWIVQREGAPAMNCKMLGVANVDGELCVQVVCKQESPTWNAKLSNLPAWQCASTYYLHAKRGTTYKLVRELTIRDPQTEKGKRIYKMTLTQSTSLVYAGSDLLDRTADFEAAAHAQLEYEKVATGKSTRVPKNHMATISHQIKFELDKPRASPYRPAMKELLRVVEAAEKMPASKAGETLPPLPVMPSVVGRPARSISVRELEKDTVVSLKTVKGKTAVFVYCDPTSPLSQKALAAVMQAVKGEKNPAAVYAVCTKTDKTAVDALRATVYGDYKVCKAQVTDRSYRVKNYPHTIVVDADGILRANYDGLGPDLAATVSEVIETYGMPTEKVSNKKEEPSYIR